jgi:hypothetical protein
MGYLIGHPDRQASGICVRKRRHGRNPHLARGTDYSAGDFSPVGDEQLADFPSVQL